MGEVVGVGEGGGGCKADHCHRPDPLATLCRQFRPPPFLPWLNASHLNRLKSSCTSWQTYQDLCLHGPYGGANQELLGGGTAGWIYPATAVTSLAVLALAVLCVYTCYRNFRGRPTVEPQLSTHLHRLASRGVRWLETRQVALRPAPHRRRPHPRPVSTASKTGLLPTSPSLATVTSDKIGGHDTLDRSGSFLRERHHGEEGCLEGEGKPASLPGLPGLGLDLGAPFSTGVEMFSVPGSASSVPPDHFPSNAHGSHPVLDLPRPHPSQDPGETRIHPPLPPLGPLPPIPRSEGPRPSALYDSWGRRFVPGYCLGRAEPRPLCPRLGVGSCRLGRVYEEIPPLPRTMDRRYVGNGCAGMGVGMGVGVGFATGGRVYDVGYANPAYEGNEQLQRLRGCCPECLQMRETLAVDQLSVTREDAESTDSNVRELACSEDGTEHAEDDEDDEDGEDNEEEEEEEENCDESDGANADEDDGEQEPSRSV